MSGPRLYDHAGRLCMGDGYLVCQWCNGLGGYYVWVDDMMNLMALGLASWTVGLRDGTIVSPFWDPF